MFHVYLLRCADGTLYVGSCEVLEKRVAAHRRGEAAMWTAQRLPIEFAYSEELQTRAAAVAREHQIKRWTRAKKEALIAGEIEQLHALAKRRE